MAFWRGTNTDNTLVDRFTLEDFRNVRQAVGVMHVHQRWGGLL